MFRITAVISAAVMATLGMGCGGGDSRKPPGISISTTAISDGTIGATYNESIEASGGTTPFSWNVSSGSLPHGLSLGNSASDQVIISGTPDTAQAGVVFTIQVRDARGQSATRAFTIDIKSTVVATQSGPLQGVVDGDEVAFRGIPYAAAPVGELRWKPPQAPPTWTDSRDASAYGDMCPQTDDTNLPVGNEDCLLLNVFFSTQQPHGTKQPVMVFIHGGGNWGGGGGGGGGKVFNVPRLAKQGVIVVTIQYRLGALGFLAHPLLTAEGGGSSGNYGVMDQIAALTWVQQNIGNFGGDSARVMVFGHSAGSLDIQALLTSPMAHGLFSAAAMMSGSTTRGYVTPLANLESLDQSFVRSLGCDTAIDVLACLRAIAAEEVVSKQDLIPPNSWRSRTLVVEPRVIPVDPFDALQANGTPVPLLIGATSEETSGLNATEDPTATPPLDEAGYEAALHTEFDPFGAGVANRVLGLYPALSYDAPVYALIAADSDFQQICLDRSVASSAVHANGPPVWRYLYTHRYENDATLNKLRAFHGSMIPFVFGSPDVVLGRGTYTPSPAEVTLSDQMMGYWSRFAKTGNPNEPGSTAWPRYDAGSDALLQLDENQLTLDGYHNGQCDYLLSLLP